MSDIPRITRAEFKIFTDALVPLMRFGADDTALESFCVPVGPSTRVTVTFHGPVTLDSYDKLLSQLAFFKTMVPAEGVGGGFTKAEAEALIDKATDAVFASRRQEPSNA